MEILTQFYFSAMSAASLYIVFYLTFVVRKPKIIAKPGSFIYRLIKQRCPFATELYWPTIWCYGGRAQTVVGGVLKSHPLVTYEREILRTRDGGEIALDWCNTKNPTNPLTVLILPGLTGTSQLGYVLHFVLHVTQKLNCAVVVLNNRGLGGLQLKTPRVCCAADTEDLEYVISHLKNKQPRRPVMVAGISLGGIILTNFLCKMAEGKSDITDEILGAAIISTPWDLFKTSNSLEQPLNRILFNRHLTKLLQNVLKEHLSSTKFQEMTLKLNCDINSGLNSSTVREFDDKIIAPMSGFKDCNEYYSAATLHTKPLCKINIPLLCLNAADDPFAPEESIPFELLSRCPNIAMVLTKHGGHVGFTEGLFPRGAGLMEKVIVQYSQALFEHWSQGRHDSSLMN